MFLAIDPGDTVGYAVFTDDGELSWMGDLSSIILDDWLKTLADIETVIVEQFRRWPGKELYYSKDETVQVIGHIKSWAHVNHVKVVEQPSELKVIGYKYMGVKPPKKKSETHKWDATAHGVYWLTRKGIREIKP